ncbi:MAG: 4Fe-4S binding protein [Nitrospirae bacterium]|nr:MAG: putative adenylylsulfate reductase, subunit B [Leptospirillum sp. Group IV 'UBA BS']MCL4485550.1 4Fe-4S binding protein [Nitrospirota bacterium]MCL5285820.1 4Fe-4S binding protein [Nitrospirota bacterium]
MGIAISESLCHGCKKLSEARCVVACPGNLIRMDGTGSLAVMREQADCWDCYACVKMCPVGAIDVVLPYELAGREARLMPKLRRESIRWTLSVAGEADQTFELATRVPEELLESEQ